MMMTDNDNGGKKTKSPERVTGRKRDPEKNPDTNFNEILPTGKRIVECNNCGCRMASDLVIPRCSRRDCRQYIRGQ